MPSHHPRFAFSTLSRMLLLFALAALTVESRTMSALTSPADGPWSGSIQCQVNVDQNNYSRHETQTWTLTGKKLAPNGQMRIYEAAWTVTGQGQFLTAGGQGMVLLTKWTMNVPATNAALSFFMGGAGQTMLRIQNWSQTRADNAIAVTQQLVQNGVIQPQTQPRPPGSVHEWNFGMINEILVGDTLSGTHPIQVANLGALMQPYGQQTQTAACTWQFTRSSASSKANSQKCSQATASITKYFDSMEADVAKQFEALIQQTTDPNQAASLKNQEQATIAQLEQLKQQNLTASSSNCGTQTANNSTGSGNSNSNAGQTSGGMGQGTGGTPNQNSGPSSSNTGTGPTGGMGQQQSDPSQTGNAGPPASDSSPQPGATDPGSQRSPAAQLLTVEPNSATQNTTTLQVALTAQGTHWERGKTTLNFGPGITTQGDPFFTMTTAYAVISVAPDAAIGPRSVTVITPLAAQRETVSLPNGFNVTAPALSAADIPHPDKTALASPSQNPTPPINVAAVRDSLPDKQAKIQPASTSGNYLVTITHLRSVTSIEMNNDPRDQDGKGDEIYTTAWVRRYDRAGTFLEQSNVQSKVYGDTRNLAPKDREQAGSLSPTGGIRSGDNIPANATDQRWGTPSDSRFPLKLWQGSLADGGDVLVLSPSIWESNDDQSVLFVWGQTQNALGNSLWNKPEVQTQINQRIFGPLVLGNVNGVSGNLGQATASVISAAFGFPVLALPARAILGGGIDRPIGLIPNGTDSTALPNVTIVLTREIIERALTGGQPAQLSNSTFGPGIVGPGILAIDVQDTFRPSDWTSFNSGLGVNANPGKYRLVLQVERVP